MNILYRDYPQLPQELLPEVYLSLLRPDVDVRNKDLDPDEEFKFRLHIATKPLREWFNDTVRPLVTHGRHNYDSLLGVQVLKDLGLLIHKDFKRSLVLNYVIETGGDNANTHIFNEERTQIIESCKIEPNRWHELNVGMYHTVTGIVGRRVALTFTMIQ